MKEFKVKMPLATKVVFLNTKYIEAYHIACSTV